MTIGRRINDPEAKNNPIYDGTLKSPIDCYQRDPESGYASLGHSTQVCYDEWCAKLVLIAGTRRIDRITGRDLRRWFLEIMKPAEKNGPPRVRLARGCVRQMMPILLNYGAEQCLTGCLDLAQVLERMTLRVPAETRIEWKASRPKKVAMTFAQAEAIVDAGIAKGTRRHRSVAIGVAAQFEFTLRQIDVIGSWSKVNRARQSRMVRSCAMENSGAAACAMRTSRAACSISQRPKPARTSSSMQPLIRFS